MDPCLRSTVGVFQRMQAASFHSWDGKSIAQGPKIVKQPLFHAAEGAVFIGNIPIPMIRKAQHMTSAFKMDEREYPMGRASIPTDRFYDDFDLKFKPIKDSTDGLKHFYQMDPESAQYIECDIYTGRLKPLAGNGDKYAQISKYLNKYIK